MMINWRSLISGTLFTALAIYYGCLEFAESGCFGLVQFIRDRCIWVLLIVLLFTAILFSLRKKQSGKLSFNPLPAIIIIAGILFLFVARTFSDRIKGGKWIEATAYPANQLSVWPTLLFRNNGKFTYYSRYADFNCFETGRYRKAGDTIIIYPDELRSGQEHLSNKYIIKPNRLIPEPKINAGGKKLPEFTY